MTDEPEDAADEGEETEFEFDVPGAVFIDDLQAVVFDPPKVIGGHEVFAAMVVAGELLLGLTRDMKMRRLEIVKGMPTKAVVREIHPKD